MTPGLSPFVEETRFFRNVALLRRMRWAGHVACMGERRGGGVNRGKDPGVDGRTTLRCIFRKWDGAMDWI